MTAPSPTGEIVAPPPNPALGERSDGRLDLPPKRHWRIVPEILLFPFRGLFWVAYYPTKWGLEAEDKHHGFARFTSWFTWNDGQRGIRPAFYYTTIYVPEFGLRYYDHLTLGPDTNLSLTTTVGGANYVYSALQIEPTRVSDPIGVTLDVVFDRRGDLLYNGLGSHTYSDAPAGRYLMNAIATRMGLRVRLVPFLTLFAGLEAAYKNFGNGDKIGGDVGIIYQFNTELIPGFTNGVSFIRPSVSLVLDARNQIGRPSKGVIASVAFDYTRGISGDSSSFPRMRAAVTVPINLWSNTHILILHAATEMAWQTGPVLIPFSELPTLGGSENLRGFRYQDFRDYTSLYFTGEYRWPLAFWLDGSIYSDYGGVFGPNFQNFGTRQMQPDVGIGIRAATSNRFYLRAQLAYGFGEGLNFTISGNGP